MHEIYLAGAVAAFTVDCLIYPLDTLKTRYQSQDYIKTFASPSGKARQPLYRGLYQGIGSVIIATLPAAGLFFATYESMKQTIAVSAPSAPRALVHSSASALAEMASCIVLAPAEVIKQNAQMIRVQSTDSQHHRRQSTSLAAIRQIARPGAWGALFTGYSALVARNLPFTALQFPLFEELRRVLWHRQLRGRGIDQRRGLLETGVISGVSAGMAGGFAAWATTPIDVIKTRMMLQAGDETARHRRIQAIFQDVLRESGVKGLFRGGGMRSTWTALGSGLYLGTYETSKAWIVQGQRKKA